MGHRGKVDMKRRRTGGFCAGGGSECLFFFEPTGAYGTTDEDFFVVFLLCFCCVFVVLTCARFVSQHTTRLRTGTGGGGVSLHPWCILPFQGRGMGGLQGTDEGFWRWYRRRVKGRQGL